MKIKICLITMLLTLSGCSNITTKVKSGHQPTIGCNLITLSVNDEFDWRDYCLIEMQKDAVIFASDIDTSSEGIKSLQINVTNPDGSFTQESFPVYIGTYSPNDIFEEENKIKSYRLDTEGNLTESLITTLANSEVDEELLISLIGHKINTEETYHSTIQTSDDNQKINPTVKPQQENNSQIPSNPTPVPDIQPISTPISTIEPVIECIPSGGQQFLDSSYGGNGGAFQACVDACSSMSSCECVPNNCGNGYTLR